MARWPRSSTHISVVPASWWSRPVVLSSPTRLAVGSTARRPVAHSPPLTGCMRTALQSRKSTACDVFCATVHWCSCHFRRRPITRTCTIRFIVVSPAIVWAASCRVTCKCVPVSKISNHFVTLTMLWFKSQIGEYRWVTRNIRLSKLVRRYDVKVFENEIAHVEFNAEQLKYSSRFEGVYYFLLNCRYKWNNGECNNYYIYIIKARLIPFSVPPITPTHDVSIKVDYSDGLLKLHPQKSQFQNQFLFTKL